MAYPISKGRLINIALFRASYENAGQEITGPWASQVEPSEILALFKGWEPEAQTLISVGSSKFQSDS